MDTEKMIKECTPWARLAIAANTHLKSALLDILHNKANDPMVKGLPSNAGNLYTFLQKSKDKIQKSGQIKGDQVLILFPTHVQSVDSSEFDITLIRYLIRTFCHIKNAKGRFDEPDASDTTLFAYVYRAAEVRNKIYHYGNIQGLDDKTFEDYWDKMKIILKGLKYAVDIDPDRTAILDKSKLQDEILKEFQDHLQNYKHELSDKMSQEFYIERRLSLTDPSSGNIMVTDIEKLIKENDRVMIYADAGVGKSATARKLKYDWCKEKMLNDFNLIYFNSKQINQKIKYHSHIAPLFFSELGDYLRGKGKSSKTFVYHDVVTMKTDNLIVLVDGIDELPIERVDEGYIDELERKVLNNEEISASDTINAIYFGFLFPFSKVCLLGRTGEFERLTKIKSEREASIFNEEKRKVKDLELLKFDDVNIQDFTCFKICGQQQQGQPNCSGACLEIYEKIKDIEICTIPTDLNSLLELHKKHPNQNIGRITRTKLMIATLLNRLNEHTKGKNYSTCNTFYKIGKQRAFDRHIECICSLEEVSFKTLLQDNITIQVDEKEDSNGVAFFTYEDQIKVDRKTLEELDFFYVRDFNYYFKLEPYHTLNIEFLTACYFFTHPDEWDSISKLKTARQLVIFQFIAGLHSGDIFTKDFANYALNVSDVSPERFFNRLSGIRESLPNDGSGYAHWFGFLENGDVSPSLSFLNSISNELDIPQRFIPSTIAFFDINCAYQFEWYDMKYFSHNFFTKVSDRFNLESFLERYPKYNFLIRTDIVINNDHEFDVLNKCKGDSRVTFQMSSLHFEALLDSSFTSHFKVDSLYIERKCDSRTIDMLFNALLPSYSCSFNSLPFIQCDRLFFFKHLNPKQTKTLFNLGVAKVFDCISLRCIFFKDKQVEILREVELNQNKLMNIEWCGEGFECLFDLPNLWKRHLSLSSITNMTDNDLIRLSKYIIPVHSANLSKYKIIQPSIPFARKKNHLLGNEESMYLNFYRVIFTNVSPEVFASTFSSVPSLTFGDVEFGIGIDYGYIPESHWLSLSQTEDALINEMRIWYPQPKHYEHFLNIKTNMIQFVCLQLQDLLQLIDHIKNNQTVQSDKEIRVFAVKCYHYVEIPLFSTKIEEFKEFSFDNFLSRNVDLFHGCDNPDWWCCEISVPFQKY